MRVALAIILCLLPLAAPAQDRAQDRARTLADIRQELVVLSQDVNGLKRELSTTGLPPTAAGGTTALERLDAIEQALQDLTAQTEALDFRIKRVVEDGTNRIGDLQFRLTELEGGDVAALGKTLPLGGEAAVAPAPAAPVPGPSGPELAVGEKADFEAAQAALDAGSFDKAEKQFARFAETYPGGTLAHEAHYYRGQALSALGETAPAARAYLESFSGAPDGRVAPDALLQLGRSLGALGQDQDACVTLDQVGVRFPGSAAASEAALVRQRFNCP